MNPIHLAHGTSLTGMNEKNTRKILALFMDSLLTYERKLKQAYANKDLQGVVFATDELLGGAYYCGVPILQDTMKQFLMALQEKPDDERLWGLYNTVLATISDLNIAYQEFTASAQ